MVVKYSFLAGAIRRISIMLLSCWYLFEIKLDLKQRCRTGPPTVPKENSPTTPVTVVGEREKAHPLDVAHDSGTSELEINRKERMMPVLEC